MTAPVRAPSPSSRRPTRASGAPSAAPESPERFAPSARPPLRLVDDSPVASTVRRPRGRAALVVGGLVVVALLFGVVSFHAVLVSGQDRLDGLQQDVVDEEARYQALRLRVAELESPERIVEVAQGRLGMVEPPQITYLEPVESEVVAASPAPARSGAGDTWVTVKPLLGGDR